MDLHKYLSLLLTLLLISLRKASSVENQETDGGLFTTGDKVRIVNGREAFSSLFNDVHNVDITWILLFYNKWCGHCIRFAPKFKQFANDVYEWQMYVKIAVVDCAHDFNTRLCSEQKLDGYPTVELVNRFTRQRLSDGIETVSELRSEIARFLTSLMHHKEFDALKPIRNTNSIPKHLTSQPGVKYSFLILTPKDTELPGLEVKLDLSRQKDIFIGYMALSDTLHARIQVVPSAILQIYSNGSHFLVAQTLQTVGELVMAIEQRTHRFRAIAAYVGDLLSGKRPDQRMASKGRYSRAPSVNLLDLESGLTYIFTKEVAVATVISGAKLNALKRFINVLVKYFPCRPHIGAFLQKVVIWLDAVKTTLTGQTWSEQIRRFRTKQSYLSEIDWVGCAGSLSRYRGYPCSLWMIFHTLTVAAYNASMPMASQAHHPSDHLEVLVAIKGYVAHFFGCKECSVNFLHMAVDMERKVMNHRMAVWWLWQAHNSANKRLRGDLTEDPEHPKTQFPDQRFCQRCSVKRHLPGETNATSWYLNNVLDFLTQYYDRYNMEDSHVTTFPYELEPGSSSRSKASDWLTALNLLKQRRSNKTLPESERSKLPFPNVIFYRQPMKFLHAESSRTGHITSRIIHFRGVHLNTFDLGLCFLLWLFSVLILLCVYFKLSFKRRRCLPL